MKHCKDQIPLYAAGQSGPDTSGPDTSGPHTSAADQSAMLKAHLAGCPECRAELAFWQKLAGEIAAENAETPAPAGLPERALAQIHAHEAVRKSNRGARVLQARFFKACRGVLSLLLAQVYLVRRELWPASAGVMALVVITALLSNHAEAVAFAVPLIAAASLASLYGPENDPAHELTLAAPTSPWKILLARLSIVSAYNLLLAALASLAMLLIVPFDLLAMIILGWLMPMVCLSILALLLSQWIGTGNAVVVSYGLWIAQFLQVSRLFTQWRFSGILDNFLAAYHDFWQSPGLLLIISLALLCLVLISARFSEHGLAKTAA